MLLRMQKFLTEPRLIQITVKTKEDFSNLLLNQTATELKDTHREKAP